MRTLRILLLILGCYLAGWVTADLLVPHVLVSRQVLADRQAASLAQSDGVARGSTAAPSVP